MIFMIIFILMLILLLREAFIPHAAGRQPIAALQSLGVALDDER